MDLDWTLILVAAIGIIPATLALYKSHKTNNSVKLAGTDVTIKNWNALIANLYGEIDRLTTLNQKERTRAKQREGELLGEISRIKGEFADSRKLWAQERSELLAQVENLKNELLLLEKRITQTLDSK